MIKNKTSELQSVQAELDRARTRISDVESDNAELKEKINDLENNKLELKKTIAETEMTVQQLEREKRDLQSEIEVRRNLEIDNRAVVKAFPFSLSSVSATILC